MNKKKNFFFNILLSFSILILLVLCFELSLRCYFVFSGEKFLSNPDNKLAKEIKDILPFRTFGQPLYQEKDKIKYILDRFGKSYPYQKEPNTYRIVCLGGSTTENLLNYQQSGIHYPMLLEQQLQQRQKNKKIEVINLGYAGYSTIHAVILLAFDVIYWNPDLIILSDNINDLTASYWPNFETNYSNKYSHSFYSVPPYRKYFTTLNALFQHFRSYWWLKQKLGKLREPSPSLAIKRKSYGLNPPEQGLATFQTNLITFATIAKKYGISLILASEPLEPSLEMFNRHIPNKEYNEVVVYPLQNELVNHHRLYNETIKQVAQKEKVFFLDQQKDFDSKTEYFSDLVHLTDLGIKKLAENYLTFIISQHLID